MRRFGPLKKSFLALLEPFWFFWYTSKMGGDQDFLYFVSILKRALKHIVKVCINLWHISLFAWSFTIKISKLDISNLWNEMGCQNSLGTMFMVLCSMLYDELFVNSWNYGNLVRNISTGRCQGIIFLVSGKGSGKMIFGNQWTFRDTEYRIIYQVSCSDHSCKRCFKLNLVRKAYCS